MRVLLVEDDPLLGDGLRAAFDKAGFKVVWAKDGSVALGLLRSQEYAAMVLDIGLPGIDGMDVLRQLRADGNRLPVLMLTARDTTRDKVLALDRGADDYVVKTAEMEELIARLRALVRRAGNGRVGALVVGDMSLDLANHTVTIDGNSIALSTCEFVVLRALLEGSGRVLTRRQLEEQLYGWKKDVDSNAIEVHIHNLRHKLGQEAIRTVRGIGYTIARQAS
jgi:two-component system response regulator QseB